MFNKNSAVHSFLICLTFFNTFAAFIFLDLLSSWTFPRLGCGMYIEETPMYIFLFISSTLVSIFGMKKLIIKNLRGLEVRILVAMITLVSGVTISDFTRMMVSMLPRGC